MADVLGEDTQQCAVAQECTCLLAARQELWEPLPDVTEHWPCLFQASNQHISPRDADSACATGARRFLGMTEPLGGDAANSAYPRDKAGVVTVYNLP